MPIPSIDTSTMPLRRLIALTPNTGSALPSMLHAELIDSGAMPVSEGEVFGPRWRQIIGSVRPRAT
ncbi:hypothetical protein DB807_24010, partial [Xanthomonas perforans]